MPRTIPLLLLAFFIGLWVPVSHAADTADSAPFLAPERPDKGWQGLAKILKKLEPSTDTRLPLSASQITQRIKTLLDKGQYDQALQAIERRKQQLAEEDNIGEDVQLSFLEGRALVLSADYSKALTHYRDMTTRFPELPEPWNNLAIEYARQGNLDEAEQALLTALYSDPDYGQAHLNLGLVRLMQAEQAFEKAESLKTPQAATLREKTATLLQR